MAIRILALNAHNSRILGEAGACFKVVEAMTAFPGDRVIQEKGCMAIRILAVNADNSRKLGEAGACSKVVDAMMAFPGDRDIRDNGCIAITNSQIYRKKPCKRNV